MAGVFVLNGLFQKIYMGIYVWFDHKWKKFSGAIETQNGGSMDTPS